MYIVLSDMIKYISRAGFDFGEVCRSSPFLKELGDLIKFTGFKRFFVCFLFFGILSS